jgi:hypothetical protein
MARDPIVQGRIQYVRDICNKTLERDDWNTRDGWNTDRAWLAQSVINILDGLIDDQIIASEGGSDADRR